MTRVKPHKTTTQQSVWSIQRANFVLWFPKIANTSAFEGVLRNVNLMTKPKFFFMLSRKKFFKTSHCNYTLSSIIWNQNNNDRTKLWENFLRFVLQDPSAAILLTNKKSENNYRRNSYVWVGSTANRSIEILAIFWTSSNRCYLLISLFNRVQHYLLKYVNTY